MTDTVLFLALFLPVLEANIEAIYDILIGDNPPGAAEIIRLAGTDETNRANQKLSKGPSGSTGTVQFRDLRANSRRSPGRTAPLLATEDHCEGWEQLIKKAGAAGDSPSTITRMRGRRGGGIS